MIRKLRRKFILINMSLVLLVLCIVFGVLLLSTYRNQQREVVSNRHQPIHYLTSLKILLGCLWGMTFTSIPRFFKSSI